MTPTTHTAQAANHANLQDDRYARGWQKLKEVDDVAGERVVEALADVSPDLGRYVVELGFSDVYSRLGPTLREREIATIAALTALGNTAPQLKVHITAGLNVGLTRKEVTETILQMVPYAGFPATLNGMSTVKEMFAAHDTEGAAATSGSTCREASS